MDPFCLEDKKGLMVGQKSAGLAPPAPTFKKVKLYKLSSQFGHKISLFAIISPLFTSFDF